MKKSGIYEIINTVNGKKYVGSSYDVKKRIQTHQSRLRTNKHINKHLQNAYNKYGVENFEFNIVELCGIDKLTEQEKYHLSKVNESYNIRKVVDSNLGIKLSEETKKKIGRSSLGRVVSKKTRKLISEALKGKPKTKEGVLKMKKALTGRKLTDEHKSNISKNHPNKGKSLPEETRKKISENHKNKNIKPPSRLGVRVDYKPRPKMRGKLSGGKNPMYGKSVKDVWVEKYGKNEAEKMWCKRYTKKCIN